MSTLSIDEMNGKLRSYRTAMMNLFGDKYKSVIIPYIEVINAASKSLNVDTLQATIRLCKCDDPHLKIALMAACVEILEPSDPPNTRDQPHAVTHSAAPTAIGRQMHDTERPIADVCHHGEPD